MTVESLDEESARNLPQTTVYVVYNMFTSSNNNYYDFVCYY